MTEHGEAAAVSSPAGVRNERTGCSGGHGDVATCRGGVCISSML
jgi:hypothetical protein